MEYEKLRQLLLDYIYVVSATGVYDNHTIISTKVSDARLMLKELEEMDYERTERKAVR